MKFENLKGKTFTKVEQIKDTALVFTDAAGNRYVMYHRQDCSEYVYIESVVGDLEDLVGTPILLAEESSSDAKPETKGNFATWTFYKLATIKGYVDVRWFGESNGYYSEKAELVWAAPDWDGVNTYWIPPHEGDKT